MDTLFEYTLDEYDVKKRFNITDCCLSCHEDADEYGYELLYLELDGQLIEVCCAVMNAYDRLMGK